MNTYNLNSLIVLLSSSSRDSNIGNIEVITGSAVIIICDLSCCVFTTHTAISSC